MTGHERDERWAPARPLLAVSLAVFRDDRVLIAERAKPPLAGLWSLPGGLVEAGETLESAALREVREEVGVAAKVVAFNRHAEIIERGTGGLVVRHYVIASFVGVWIAGPGAPGAEARAVRWATQDDVRALSTTPGLPDILDAAWSKARAVPQPC